MKKKTKKIGRHSSGRCNETEYTCSDGKCIDAAMRCDNFYDCKDFSDEQYCLGYYP
jgi:hypothetical protein